MNGMIELNLAMSLDGYIVDENGKYDWIKGDGDNSLNTDDDDSDFSDLVDSYDVIVMGKNSYMEFGKQELFIGKKIIVATHDKVSNTNDVTYLSENLVSYVCSLRDKGKKVWLFGGSVLTDNFIKANEVDSYKVGIVPIIIGRGKQLFLGNNPKVKLHLDTFTSKEGLIILTYSKRRNLI